MNTSVRPGNDFYRYANGNWERRTQIPPEAESFGGETLYLSPANRV